MPPSSLRRAVLFFLAAAAVLAAGAPAALVKVDDIVLRADGGFQPQTLPRARYAPIEFQGRIDISAKGGGKPSALQEAVIDFDRDGRLNVAGLSACRSNQLGEEGARGVRETCGGAIVGTGRIEVEVDLNGTLARVGSELTILNGPPEDGHPTAILHTRIPAPIAQTFVIVVPIERRPGPFRYRATLEIPPIAGGLGALTHLEVAIGRRYRAGGQERSYVSARCSDNILETHGRFSFEDGTIIDGVVEKFCRSK
ncbi:MAG TPA: hypothetical protein VD741_02770 [Solirubrobacterales bacterium]|nr:hypothetical protein [Solirubrobacterales bacterium]